MAVPAPTDSILREHLAQLLRGGQAHATFEDTIRDFPLDRIGTRPPGAAHSAWELLEHLRIAQRDILEFSRSADYVSPKWPEGYWPTSPAPEKPDDWIRSAAAFEKDLAAFEDLIRDPKQDLYRKF